MRPGQSQEWTELGVKSKILPIYMALNGDIVHFSKNSKPMIGLAFIKALSKVQRGIL